MKTTYTPQPFILKCSFFKIYKYVPGIANILANTYYEVKDGKRNYDKLKKFLEAIDLEDDDLINSKKQLSYLSELCSSQEEINKLKETFLGILSKSEFSGYNLVEDADNLLLLCLYLYDKVWDHTGVEFANQGANEHFSQMTYYEYPQNYQEILKAKQLATYLHVYIGITNTENRDKATLTLKLGKTEAVIKDQRIFNNMTEAVIDKLTAPQTLADALQIYGETGFQLLMDLGEYKRNSSETTLAHLQARIHYILNIENKNPYPVRYKAISYFCLCLREYLVGANLIGTSKKLLHKDQLRLFAEILNLFGMRYGSLDYTTTEYTSNLSKTIRDYFKERYKKI